MTVDIIDANQENVRSTWRKCLFEFGVDSDSENAQQHFASLIHHYSDPARHYHNLTHLSSMLLFLNRFNTNIEHDPELRLAVLFHDVVYDSRAKDNEEQSAALTRNILRDLNLPHDSIERIAALILSTKDHQPRMEGLNNALLIDADLSILAAPKKYYHRYVVAIRQEYSWVSDNDYRKGRSAVLDRFLARPRIYLLEENHRTLDTLARDNMIRERQNLTGNIP